MTGPDDLKIKILELREITKWKVPIFIKIAGARPYYDTALAVKAGADANVVCVGAVGDLVEEHKSTFSNIGARVDIWARIKYHFFCI